MSGMLFPVLRESTAARYRQHDALGLLSRLTREPDEGIAPALERSSFLYNDKNLTCADCSQEFVFTASEQDFYSQRGFTEPRRCPSCRASRKAARNAEGGGSSYSSGGGYSSGGHSSGAGSYGGRGGGGVLPGTPRLFRVASPA